MHYVPRIWLKLSQNRLSRILKLNLLFLVLRFKVVKRYLVETFMELPQKTTALTEPKHETLAINTFKNFNDLTRQETQWRLDST